MGVTDDLVRRIVAALVRPRSDASSLPLVDATAMFEGGDGAVVTARRLTGAFLAALAGDDEARAHLDDSADDWKDVAAFYAHGLTAVPADIAARAENDPAFVDVLAALADTLTSRADQLEPKGLADHTWQALFPEGAGILGHEDERVHALRDVRTVTVEQPPDRPITDAGRELLLTANALITTPLSSRDPADLNVAPDVATAARDAANERQRYFYDHPIPVGIEPDANEILYGLQHLDEAIGFEKQRGTVPMDARMPCALSVSVTHHRLRDVAHDYVADVIDRAGGLQHLDVYVFAEHQTQRLVEDVLAPAARDLLDRSDTDLLDVVGVDGRYGRHYSFLKAVAALWHVLVDDRIRATFKIDLDQVFPQEVLVDVTGRSALEHLTVSQWGAAGTAADDDPVDLGMLAGALVNESDIATSLYTPDVEFPDGPGGPPDHVFFSKLPQALSTAAEMGTRYADGDPDGVSTVLERIHVTGGTTGARVDALRRHRPFTPSFIARAEDQAFVLATFQTPPRLAYLHADGLIMRHDKEAFAGEAIKAAAVGKLIGDHIRILLFSAYGSTLGDVEALKSIIDPFTGSFVSRTPVATTYLRFALQAAALLDGETPDDGVTFVRDGSHQLREALAFIGGDPSDLEQTVDRERRGWALFYDILDALERGLAENDATARRLATVAQRVVGEAAIA